jgi:hypothetical protein
MLPSTPQGYPFFMVFIGRVQRVLGLFSLGPGEHIPTHRIDTGMDARLGNYMFAEVEHERCRLGHGGCRLWGVTPIIDPLNKSFEIVNVLAQFRCIWRWKVSRRGRIMSLNHVVASLI